MAFIRLMGVVVCQNSLPPFTKFWVTKHVTRRPSIVRITSMRLLMVMVVMAVAMTITVQGYQRISIIRSKRKATTLEGRRWPDGIIPFTIDNSSIPDRDVILQAMEVWETNTCITFVELTEPDDIDDEDKTRVVFFRGTSCWAGVGKHGYPDQYVSLGQDCDFVHVVLHEIGHVIGFEHEHKRPDRDKYVRINWLNIDKDDAYNYEKRKTLTSVPYDLYSIMHYARETFSSNGLPTVLTVDPLKQYDIGKVYVLSFYDIKLANEMYNCNEIIIITFLSSSCLLKIFTENCIHKDVCQNGGFVGPSPDCHCVCPNDYYGNRCHFEKAPAPKGCRHRILKPGKLTSPNYPMPYSSKSDCIWYIKAKKDQTIRLTFTEFNIEDSPHCNRDYLNIRTKNMYQDEDKYYCGNRIPETIKTEGNEMMLLFITDYVIESKGFSAELKFENKDKIKEKYNSNCFERSCYQYLGKPASYTDAKKRCEDKGATLLMVSSAGENEFLRVSFGESLIGSSYWIDFPTDVTERETGWEWSIAWYDYLTSLNGTECCINRVFDDWIAEYCDDTDPYVICETRVSEDVKPKWRQWSEWSGCTATCGGGFKTRYRHCSLPGLCNGTTNDTAACNIAECPGSFAQGKGTDQSSLEDGDSFESWNAIDSLYWPKSSDGSCSVTKYEWEPWWVVDLGTSYTVVKLFVTIDAQRLYRMRGYVIRVGESLQLLDSNRQCRSVLSDADINGHYQIEIQCSPTPTGRYLSFQKEGHYGRITLCEVDVFVSALQCPFVDTHLVYVDSSSRGAEVTWPDPKFIDSSFGGKIKCSRKSGSFFPIGQTTVTCTAENTFFSYQNMCSFSVNVQVCTQKYNSFCYAVVHEKKTYIEAREACLKMGFDLVNIETKEENDYVWQKLLLGLTDQRDTYIAPNDKNDEGVFTLPTGENITFSNWDFEQPNNYGSGQHCTVMYKYEGEWGDEDCEFPRISVCKAPLPVGVVPEIDVQLVLPGNVTTQDTFTITCQSDSSEVPPVPTITLYKDDYKIHSELGYRLTHTVISASHADSGVYTCAINNDEGSRDSESKNLFVNGPPDPTPTVEIETCDHEYKGVCYLPIATRQNFKVSKRICRALGGQLLTIKDAGVNNFVRKLVKLEAYIGLTDMQKEGNWKWLAGGKLQFKKWMKNQPDNKGKGKGEDCVAIKPNGLWRDVSCKRKIRAVCEIRTRN
ncbi:uncharacterized protein [Antedon mediterranea]|uniref:uncharacterized protein n=1 Tax=Antedon mediterranea TaxID=105859 RepID=UPI003AF72D87